MKEERLEFGPIFALRKTLKEKASARRGRKKKGYRGLTRTRTTERSCTEWGGEGSCMHIDKDLDWLVGKI